MEQYIIKGGNPLVGEVEIGGAKNAALAILAAAIMTDETVPGKTRGVYMEQYIIKGGNPLVGEVEIGGAKNAALAILAAAIMTDETVHIENLPDVRDINVLLEAIKEIGATVDRIGPTEVKIAGATIGNITVEYEYIKKIRASYYLLGALLGKYKNAEVPLPGGCNIGSRPIDQHLGSRPIDQHLKGFRALGASVDIIHGAVVAKADHLTGKHIFMDMVSVGATINVMMAAAMAQGNTTIENAAREPHVVDVANFLNSMGANNIKGAGTDVIRIQGVDKLHGTTYSIIPDQIEAGTFMCAAAATMGDIMVKNVIPKHLEATTAKLEEIGCQVEEFDDAVRVVANKRLKRTHKCKNNAISGLSYRYAASVCRSIDFGRGDKYCNRKYF